MVLLGNGNDSSELSDEAFLAKNISIDGLVEDTAVENNADKPTDISSVITQVTSREAGQRAGHHQLRAGPQPLPDSQQLTWKSKFRSLFCCFAPQNHGYIRTKDVTGPSPRLLAPPPVPPKIHREAIIGPKRQEDLTKKTLVLDLDETLVHSSFKPIPNPDYIIPVEIDGKLVDVYVLKRPYMDHFMDCVGQKFEVVVFTASLSKYADPLLDLLDKSNVVRWRLFRESCFPYEGNYVKDLTCLGRDLAHTIIIDNSPHSYVFQPMNALPIGTFIDSMEDQELLDILPILQQAEDVDDVRSVLAQHFQL